MLDRADLPPDEYGFIEAYCNEPGCDCRRVFFHVFAVRQNTMMAVINYGWEYTQFYATWLGLNDPETLRDLQGPALYSLSPQSEYAPTLLHTFKTVLLKDINYIERLKRHYAMFREAVDEEHQQMSQPIRHKKIRRNSRCPCGSGKKYKNCCGLGAEWIVADTAIKDDLQTQKYDTVIFANTKIGGHQIKNFKVKAAQFGKL